MKYLNKFSDFKKINEFSEFNNQKFNSDTTNVSIGLAPDNTLSVNAFDRHNDMLRTGMSKINNIMKSLSNTSAFRSLKSKLTFENQQPDSLKILRIIPNNVDYNVYLSFKINDVEYDGVINNILSNPIMLSSVLKDDNLIQTNEWQIKIKGLIIESIKKWLNISKGEYKVLNTKIHCLNIITGSMEIIKKGNKIEVIKTIPSENKILIKYKNNTLSLTRDEYIYFNYWFEKI